MAITITWTAATDPDDAGSALVYRVYRDGAWIATTAAGANAFTETVVANGSTHAYAVQAQDPAGNLSALSSPLSVVSAAPSGGGGGSRLSIGLA